MDVAPINGSKLYCFRSLRRARDFARESPRSGDLRVFRCKAINASFTNAKISAILEPAAVLHFWGTGGPPSSYYVGTMTRVVSADEIMLTKRIRMS